jgi:hypothetical protein
METLMSVASQIMERNFIYINYYIEDVYAAQLKEEYAIFEEKIISLFELINDKDYRENFVNSFIIATDRESLMKQIVFKRSLFKEVQKAVRGIMILTNGLVIDSSGELIFMEKNGDVVDFNDKAKDIINFYRSKS